MTDITRVRGPEAHEFYRWLAGTHGFAPSWNFNKVLINSEGQVVGVFNSGPSPQEVQPELVQAIEANLVHS